MNKRMKMFRITLLVALISCMFVSCANLRGTADDTHINGGYQDAELMEKIADDYRDYCYEKWKIHTTFWVEYCYGVYDDSVPVMMDGREVATSHAERDVEIGKVVFHYRDGKSIEVWKDGDFYTLEEAYEQGLITEDHLHEIADVHNNERYVKETE